MQNQINIQKLFQEKRYSEIIFLLDYKISENKKNSALLNLLGVCRLLKGKPNKEELINSIKDFKKAFLKENKTQNSLHAFKNLINVSVDFFEYENSIENHQKANIFFKEILIFFNKDKDYFLQHVEIILSLIRIYKRLLNLDKIRECYLELVKKKYYTPEIICGLIYHNCFVDEWKQEDFLKHGKLLSQNLEIYEKDKLKPINKNKNKKIKIGFISSDIKPTHSVIYFFKTITNNYNKDKFEIYLYSNNKESLDDENIKSIKKSINKNRQIYGLDNIRIINIIRDDKIDILVDLMGVTSAPKLEVMKNRSAPVQIMWCGFCNTTGIEEVDFIISDPNLIYDLELNSYQEKVIFMPKIWNCHSGFNIKRTFNDPPFLKNKSITFGSLNNFNKINIKVIKTWSQILKMVPNSKLILKCSLPRMFDFLSNKFQENGVLDSIEFMSHLNSFEDHMSVYKEIDIALDTFPYNGVTTSFEAIWMGVPVMTMKGYNFNSRCGESINKNLNMEYLIAENEIEYIKKTKELSENKNRLLDIRKKIFDQALSSPLFDTESFSKDFFKSLETVYNK